MNGVSLFSGVGGIELGLHEEVKTVAYVEREPYAQAVLIKRMQEGLLDEAPIYDDVRTFDGSKYRGLVDIVFGGFPCQDISVAGKGAGIKEGTRSGLFFELMRVVSEIRPPLIFLENVSAITNKGLDTVLGSLSEAGYDARWTTIRASDVGARHRRERWFCLAYSKDERNLRREWEQRDGSKSSKTGGVESSRGGEDDGSEDVAYSVDDSDRPNGGSIREKEGLQGVNRQEVGSGVFGGGCQDEGYVADSINTGDRTPRYGSVENGEKTNERQGGQPFDRISGQSEVWRTDPADFEETSESFVGRVADEFPRGVD